MLKTNDFKNTISQTVSNVTQVIDNTYVTKIRPILSTLSQFLLWYVMCHTIYWSIEQIRYKWCVPCGFSGYVHSLVVSQSLVCRLLTETSKAMSNHQLSSITMLSSFIGLKCFSSANSANNTNNTNSANVPLENIDKEKINTEEPDDLSS